METKRLSFSLKSNKSELVSLKIFCKKQGIPLDRAMVELREAGFKVNRPDKTLGDIADSKGTSGMAVYL